MLGLPTETEEDMKAIADLADQIARRYYEIPKGSAEWKMSDHSQYFFLYSKPFTPFQWARCIRMKNTFPRAPL